MKRRAFFLLWLSLVPSPLWAYSRIVSLKPNITEILFDLGVGDRVVGVTSYCDRPEAAKQLPKVADYIRAFPEPILQLKPDLILGSEENSSQREVYFLRDRGIEAKLLPFTTIAETKASILAIGQMLDRTVQAQQLTQQMDRDLEALRQASAGLTVKKTLFVVGYQPLIVAGSHNFLDEASTYLGAINVAKDSRLKYPAYTTEHLIHAAPEVVIDLAMGSERTEKKSQARQEWWRQFPSIPAVRDGKIYSYDMEKIRAVPTLGQALAEILRLIHPETAASNFKLQ